MKQSQIFTKTSKELPKDEVSLNAQLLIKAGFVDKLMAGVYTYLPLGLRVLKKIQNIVREEMDKAGGQEVLMPALTPKEVWDITERWDKIDVMFKLEGAGNKMYALGSTHEEIVTPLVKKFVRSYKDLPVAVYQIQDKFRNEPRAKSGLLRGREFNMKDLYSFHKDEQDFSEFYEKMKVVYMKVYQRCGLDAVIAEAGGGVFTKKRSHEFQVFTEYGEDLIYHCKKCNKYFNQEVVDKAEKCEVCGEMMEKGKAVEVGNIFPLETRFTAPFEFTFLDKDGTQKPVLMGCYGIGPSRVMGSIVEVHHDGKGMIWPKEVTPFDCHLVSLCKDEDCVKRADEIYQLLQNEGIDVLYDDRDVRAGEKFADSDLMGLPMRIVASQKTLSQNSVEIKNRKTGEEKLISINNLVDLLKNK